jgi:protein-S-isoprenylcysteine O-methyltransferase Ste14
MRILPPPLALIFLLVMIGLRIWAPGPAMLPPPWNCAGLAPLAIGVWLLLAGSGRFRRIGTNIKTFNEPGVLVTDGLFRFSRNPMYLGFVLALLGAAMLLGTASPFVMPILFALIADLWYIRFEERALRRKFGEAYEAYARRTRRWI